MREAKKKIGFYFKPENAAFVLKHLDEIAPDVRGTKPSVLVEEIIMSWVNSYNSQKDKIKLEPGRPLRWIICFNSEECN